MNTASIGVKNVSGDFNTKSSHKTVLFYLYEDGKPIGSYPSYEEASAEEGRLLLSRLNLKPAKGGLYKAWRSHQKMNSTVKVQ